MTPGIISFTVPGAPKAKGYGYAKDGHQYKKKNAKLWEQNVALAARAAGGAAFKPHEGFVELTMVFRFAIPKSRKDVRPGMLHGQDPDATNLFKSTEDALKRILFIDDNRVVIRGACKMWGVRDECEIKVEFL